MYPVSVPHARSDLSQSKGVGFGPWREGGPVGELPIVVAKDGCNKDPEKVHYAVDGRVSFHDAVRSQCPVHASWLVREPVGGGVGV